MTFRSSVSVCLVLLGMACGARTSLPFEDVASSGSDAGIACVPGDVTLSLAKPEVMFVLDRSGSMNTEFSGGQTRWQAVTSSLAATLPPVNDTMAVGALLFPAGSSMDNCSVASTPNLAPALDNVSALISLMQGSSPGGATPTAYAIDGAASLLLGVRAATTARALVLATDGAPNCNSSLNPNTCTCASGTTGGGCRRDPNQCLDDTRTIASIATTYTQGIPTYVIGLADDDGDTFTDVLNEMALAGGRPLTGSTTSYYAAQTTGDLEAAVSTIRNQVGACTYLTTSVPNAKGSIYMTWGSTTLTFGADGGTSGWAWGSETNGQIVLYGDTCTQVSNSTVPVVAHIACGGDAGRESGVDAGS